MTVLWTLPTSVLAEKLDAADQNERIVTKDLGLCPSCARAPGQERPTEQERRVRLPRPFGSTLEQWAIEEALQPQESRGSAKRPPRRSQSRQTRRRRSERDAQQPKAWAAVAGPSAAEAKI